MEEETVKKVAKGAGIVFIGTGMGMAFAYLSAMVVARFLGPKDLGLISMASAVTTIASTVILLGIPQGVLRYVSLYKGKNDKSRIKGVIISALGIVLPLGIISTIILFLVSNSISILIFNEPNLTPVLKIFSFSIPFFVLFFVFNNAVYGLQEVKYAVYSSEIFQNSCRLFLLAILLFLGYGVSGAAFAYTVAIIATPFVAFYYLNKIFPVFSKEIKLILMKRELFSFSWPLMFAGIFILVMGWIDTLMLGYFCTSYDVGIYRASLITAGLLKIIPGSFGSIFYPLITELYSQNKIVELKEINAAVTKWIFILALPLVLLMLLFSKQVLSILYGSEYVLGYTVLIVLAFGHLIVSIFSPTNTVIPAIGRTKLIMANTSIGAAIDIALNFFLIPIYGINGAAVATAISIVAVNGLAFAEVYKMKRIQPFKRNYPKILFSAIISASLIYIITKTLFEVTPIHFLGLMFFLYMGVYFFLLLIFRTFEKEDITVMKAMEEKSGIKSEILRGIIGRFL